MAELRLLSLIEYTCAKYIGDMAWSMAYMCCGVKPISSTFIYQLTITMVTTGIKMAALNPIRIQKNPQPFLRLYKDLKQVQIDHS